MKKKMVKAPEMKKNKKNMSVRKCIPLILIAVGLALVTAAIVLEAMDYPWGVLFKTSDQNADTLPDPSPIELDEQDEGVIVTALPPALPAVTASPEQIPTPSPEEEQMPEQTEDTTLPGEEEQTEQAPAVVNYYVLGTFKIPVLGVSQNLLEGTGKQLKYGVGHVTGTDMPGQTGNCAVAGHRPYPFRYLDMLQSGDIVVVESGGITYTYTVYSSFEVLPEEVWVLYDVDGEDYTLTIITCTPYLVSSHRLIVRARLTDIDGLSPEAYYGQGGDELSETQESSTDVQTTEPGEMEDIHTDSPEQTFENPPEYTDSQTPETTPENSIEITPSADAAPSTDAVADLTVSPDG